MADARISAALAGTARRQGSQVGYAAHLQKLFAEALDAEATRGVMVQSNPGIGRTSALLDWIGQHPPLHRVLYVAAVKSQVAFAESVARKLGVPEERLVCTRSEVAAWYPLFVGSRRGFADPTVLVLDNADAMTRAHVEAILDRFPVSRVVATCTSNKHGAAVVASCTSVADFTNPPLSNKAAEEMRGSVARESIKQHYLPLDEFLAERETEQGHKGVSFDVID